MDEDELVLSLAVRRLCTNIAVEKAIESALGEVYFSDEVPEIPRSIMNSLLRLAVTNFQFNCNIIWYTHSYGLAMGSSPAAIVENL